MNKKERVLVPNDLDGIFVMFEEMLDSGTEGIFMVARGKLEGFGNTPAAHFQYTSTGKAMFRGNVKSYVDVINDKGESFTISKNMPLIAWDDVAEEMSHLQEGDQVAVYGEYDLNKYKDKYFTRMRVLHCVLEKPAE